MQCGDCECYPLKDGRFPDMDLTCFSKEVFPGWEVHLLIDNELGIPFVLDLLKRV